MRPRGFSYETRKYVELVHRYKNRTYWSNTSLGHKQSGFGFACAGWAESRRLRLLTLFTWLISTFASNCYRWASGSSMMRRESIQVGRLCSSSWLTTNLLTHEPDFRYCIPKGQCIWKQTTCFPIRYHRMDQEKEWEVSPRHNPCLSRNAQVTQCSTMTLRLNFEWQKVLKCSCLQKFQNFFFLIRSYINDNHEFSLLSFSKWAQIENLFEHLIYLSFLMIFFHQHKFQKLM